MHETIFCQKTEAYSSNFQFTCTVEQNLVHLDRFLHFSQKVVGVTLKQHCGNLLSEKNRWLSSGLEPAMAGVQVVRLWYLLQTDVLRLIIIITITYRPMLLLLKPEGAGGAVTGKDFLYLFGLSSHHDFKSLYRSLIK